MIKIYRNIIYQFQTQWFNAFSFGSYLDATYGIEASDEDVNLIYTVAWTLHEYTGNHIYDFASKYSLVYYIELYGETKSNVLPTE